MWNPLKRQAKELIHFDCRGCQATDWHEVRRGVFGGNYTTVDGYGHRIECVILREANGIEHLCFADSVHEGTAEMSQWTQNPDESLVGKLVYLR